MSALLPVALSVLLFTLPVSSALAQGTPDTPGGEHNAQPLSRHRTRFTFGQPGRAGQVQKTIHIFALDSMRFKPSTVRVRPGETVRFIVTDAGRIRHEFVIGDKQEQLEHDQEMRAMPNMPMHDPNGISLAPGQTKTLIWKFADTPGRVEYACHEPGHFAAGMIGRIYVGR
ncbi:MAG: cupredoxin domain-containing protein [Acidiferrobacteraceae bacterium]